MKIKGRRKNCYHLILPLKKKYRQHHHAPRIQIDKVTSNLFETLRFGISTTPDTTNTPIRKKPFKYLIVDLKKKLNKSKLDKRNLLRVYKYEDNSLQYHFHKYNKHKHSDGRNGYLDYKNLKRFNTKIRKLSDKLKVTYVIPVGTDHPKCAEPPNPIVMWKYQ